MGKIDIGTNEFLREPARVADLLNGFVYHGEERVKPDEVHELRSVLNRREAQGQGSVQTVTADVVTKVGKDMHAMIVVLENQTDIHYAMPVRMMNLEAMGYHSQWRQAAKAHAKGKDLIEVRRYEEYENFRTDLREVFGFLQRAEDKDGLREYLEANEEKFENLSTDAYDMISVMGHSKELQEIREKYHKEKGGRSNMCQAIKDMIEDGRQEGMQIGVQEERQRNVVSSVESVMQNLGLALNTACKALSITEEDYNRAKEAVQ